MYCPLWKFCTDVIAFSPNGFIEPTLDVEITLMTDNMKPMALVFGENDLEMTGLGAFTVQLPWYQVNGFARATQNGIDILKYLGSSAHGNDLYKENLIIFLKTEVLELGPD